jgi:hypothetical protein
MLWPCRSSQNQMGKTHSKTLAARHGRGTAWARHAVCESAFKYLLSINNFTVYFVISTIKDKRKHLCNKVQCVQLKSGPILIWVIYLLRFTTCYITHLTCIYSKCWKWCPFISMHLSTRFTMFLATYLSVLSFFNHFCNSTIYWRLPFKIFKETLSTVSIRHRF